MGMVYASITSIWYTPEWPMMFGSQRPGAETLRVFVGLPRACQRPFHDLQGGPDPEVGTSLHLACLAEKKESQVKIVSQTLKRTAAHCVLM